MLSALATGVLIEMMETHIRSVASRPDRIHHRVDVFTGVSRIWEIDRHINVRIWSVSCKFVQLGIINLKKKC